VIVFERLRMFSLGGAGWLNSEPLGPAAAQSGRAREVDAAGALILCRIYSRGIPE
jgi:hypothetical protein